MGVRIEKIDLPGMGVRHDVVTAAGQHIGVLSYRNGTREVALYDPEDPDASLASVALTAAEAAAFSDLLGHAALLSQLSGLGGGTIGLFTEQLVLPADSRYLDRPLGDTEARTKTGTSIVAILRGKEVIPSPTPSEILRMDDLIVAVGTREGLDKLDKLLAHSQV
ncbi:TrkA domain protein [Aurantimicrobium minutum]|uniref:cation:proton antiporter regulatory subunit n=1 Tax=Aurantimicrobium minutum TaxID=708131 RepID=UPI002476DC91|nr:TrkA C-terminal domain-containing protein [Aurantimicrobium minutum]MDH6533172.1 TrkA domain protein [Aurantimicrobium minutum]